MIETMNVGAKLEALRKARKLSRKKVGEGIGVDGETIRKYERNIIDISRTRILQLAEFYHVSPNELLGEAGKVSPISNNFNNVTIPQELVTLISRTVAVLESNTEWAKALESNINAFHTSVIQGKELSNHEKRILMLEEKLTALGPERRGPDTPPSDAPETDLVGCGINLVGGPMELGGAMDKAILRAYEMRWNDGCFSEDYQILSYSYVRGLGWYETLGAWGVSEQLSKALKEIRQ